MYWPAVYAFLRHHGYSVADAEDLTQDFICCLIRRKSFSHADRSKGRFRSYLLGALKHFLADHGRHTRTWRRGGRAETISLEVLRGESGYASLTSPELTPDQVFDREWTWLLLERALIVLRNECAEFGHAERFEALKGYLVRRLDPGEVEALASKLHVKTGTPAVLLHRLRRRLQQLVRGEVCRTVASPMVVKTEMDDLFGPKSCEAAKLNPEGRSVMSTRLARRRD
ncbi:MAG: sigma-70 family RNA polymerase sigma factor [Verrucomicrobiales bacterium]|nr:sigma-70 family RNA polymerase sigma factor [Verrucomicrobiales bacterium]